MLGISNSPDGWGVGGVNGATSGFATGVYGESPSTNGQGVYGNATATSGPAVGVLGQSSSTHGFGVYGHNPANSGTGVGVYGESDNSGGVGVYGYNPFGLAGQFNGNVQVMGNLDVTGKVTKGSGSFKIDHPLDPANKYLSHSFVESPDMMNVYNGIVRMDAKGEAWVTLPDYFEALNSDFRYQLTAIGGAAPRLNVAREVSENRFKIAGGRPGAKVSWQVTGIRHDAYANAHRIPVAEDKPSAEQGPYLHPDVYRQGQR